MAPHVHRGEWMLVTCSEAMSTCDSVGFHLSACKMSPLSRAAHPWGEQLSCPYCLPWAGVFPTTTLAEGGVGGDDGQTDDSGSQMRL